VGSDTAAGELTALVRALLAGTAPR
jgi:hypothetical protein